MVKNSSNILPEGGFCLSLEYKITLTLKERSESRWEYHWCDGIIPDRIEKIGKGYWLIGKAYLGPSGQEDCEFRFQLSGIKSIETNIDYQLLLSRCRGKGWLNYDPEKRYLEIIPKYYP